MTDAARPDIGWYNGWSPEERRRSTPIQRAAVADGTIPRPRTCSICGTGWSRDNPVWFHDEDYSRPLDAHHVCRTCHRTLHQRFEKPEPWLALLALNHREGAWFTTLTLDPASVRRRFRSVAQATSAAHPTRSTREDGAGVVSTSAD